MPHHGACLRELAEDDIHRIVKALQKHQGGGPFSLLPSLFHALSFGGLLFFGVVFGGLYLLYRMHLVKKIRKQEQSTVIRAVNDMDQDTLRKVVGEGNIPSWITFPDMERVGWLNNVLTQLWPHISTVITRKAFELLDPLLSQNKPPWIAGISLHKFDMGQLPPQLTGAKAYGGDSVTDQSVMDIDFVWPGQQEVVLLIQPIPKKLKIFLPLSWAANFFSSMFKLKVGVEKVSFNGRARVTFRPLASEVPIVQAIQVSLVERPKFDFDVTFYGGDVTFLPGLELWLHAFIRDNVLRPYVLPEYYLYPLIDRPLGEMEKPRGMLFIKVIEAVHVPRMDWLSQSDPYVKLWVRDKRTVKTQVKHRSKDPKWNEEFELLVHAPDHQYLELELYDWDFLDKDDEIGRAQVPIRDLPEGETKDLWVDVNKPGEQDDDDPPKRSGSTRQVEKTFKRFDKLLHREGRSKDSCRLHLQVTYFEFKAEEQQQGDVTRGRHCDSTPTDDGTRDQLEQLLKGGVLYVRVKKATQLPTPAAYKIKAPKISVRVTVDGEEKWTAKLKGREPAWDEPLEFVLSGKKLENLQGLKITMEVVEHVIKSRRIGHVDVLLQEVVERKMISNTYALKGSKRGQLAVNLQWMGILEAG